MYVYNNHPLVETSPSFSCKMNWREGVSPKLSVTDASEESHMSLSSLPS